MEALALLALAAALGIPSATRWLAFALLGPLALFALAVWLLRADLGDLAWLIVFALGGTVAGVHERLWRQKRGLP